MSYNLSRQHYLRSVDKHPVGTNGVNALIIYNAYWLCNQRIWAGNVGAEYINNFAFEFLLEASGSRAQMLDIILELTKGEQLQGLI